MSQNQSIFSEFTNLYSLTKTLRFELKPTEKTKDLLQKTNNSGLTPIQKDKNIDRLYNEEMKPMLDQLHEKFINDSLESLEFDVDNLVLIEEKYSYLKNNLLKNKKDNEKKILEAEDIIFEAKKVLKKKIVEVFGQTAESWKAQYPKIQFKKNSYEILTEVACLELLKSNNPEKLYVVEKFKSFWTYFGGFNENRKNYYTTEDKATEISNRIINENLFRFIDNKEAFEKFLKFNSDLELILSEYKANFEIISFNEYLNQAGIDNFNRLVGGFTLNNGQKIQGINEKINLFKQQNKDAKLGQLKLLYKQIGSHNDKQVFLEIQEGKEWYALEEIMQNQVSVMGELEYFPFLKKALKEGDLEHIYLNKAAINTISSKWFLSWQTLAQKMVESKIFGYDKKEDKLKIPEAVSLKDIKTALESLDSSSQAIFKPEYTEIFLSTDLWEVFVEIWLWEVEKLVATRADIGEKFLNQDTTKFDKQIDGQKIKNFLDVCLNYERMVRYHIINSKYLTKYSLDGEFYNPIEEYLQNSQLIEYYNAFRNYISKKPFKTEKIKLNFENGILLDGWSDGQEKNKGGVILQNQGKFYLGVLMNRGFFRTDKPNQLYQTEDKNWQRLILTNLKFQTLAGKGFLGKYGKSYGDLGKTEPLRAVALLQEFIIQNYISKYPQLQEVAEKKYQDKKIFDAEIKTALEACFTMSFIPIKYDILEIGLTGDLYLFEITNKDFERENKESKESLETIYWKNLFSLENLNSPTIALNGGGEIFFRNGQKDKLLLKKDKQGKNILDAKRYADDKFFFHIPITINYGKPKQIKFKDYLNDKLESNKDQITYLGIDRGEKHLAYYCLINNKSNNAILIFLSSP